MDILYTLIPLSVVLVFLIIGILAWAVHAGQFEDLDAEAARIIADDPVPGSPPSPFSHHVLDLDQSTPANDQPPSAAGSGRQ